MNIFTHSTLPDKVDTDDGGEFKSHIWKNFVKKYKIHHRMSAPYFPQANGRAELAIKKVLKLLEDETDEQVWKNEENVQLALMMIRNTNDKNGVSPSQIMFGRPIKDHLPLMDQQGKDID